ncbi:MAG: hypothetical protein BGO77_02825 [Caedibacter sp. 37-49]|nr:MAG: hypothetical protein BGO77_02825 [Caedibacter sp. 37-49]
MNKIYKLFLVNLLLVCKLSFATSNNKAIIDAYEEDLQLSKTRSLICGFDIPKNKVVWTLGFRDIGKGIKHAYVVREMCVRDKSGDDHISIEGFHLGATDDGYISNRTTVGLVYGYGSAAIHVEPSNQVLAKFFRGKKIEKNHERKEDGILYEVDSTAEIAPLYTKYKSFIVDANSADKAWKTMQEDEGKISFSAKGYGIIFKKENTFNCCTYAARILRTAGVDLRESDSKAIIKDSTYLRTLISKYETRVGGDEKKVRTPVSVKEIFDQFNIK